MVDIPFTKEQFFDVFAAYNSAIWPAIPLFVVTALIILFAGARKKAWTPHATTVFLSASWLWIGAVYHIGFFSPINRAAFLFGALFIIQGLLFLSLVLRGNLIRPVFSTTARCITGIAFIVYALILYPLIGVLSGHSYPAMPLFGVAPCPTTIFTFGLLLAGSGRIPRYLLIVPALWTVLGVSAALNFGVVEDFGLTAAGLIGTAMITLAKPSQPVRERI